MSKARLAKRALFNQTRSNCHEDSVQDGQRSRQSLSLCTVRNPLMLPEASVLRTPQRLTSRLALGGSLLGPTKLLELPSRLSRCSPGSAGFSPDVVANRFRTLVNEMMSGQATRQMLARQN
jgi:hypothetical protein